MKIVHELYGGKGSPQTPLSGRAYTSPIAKPPEWSGMRMEILICDTEKPLGGEGDSFWLEGDSKAIRSALEAVLAQMDMYEQLERERFEARASKYVQCSKCSKWTDPTDEWHGDGLGNRCELSQSQKL